MSEPADVELRRLQERAYGPAADISVDPVARRRLDALEHPSVGPPRTLVAAPADPPHVRRDRGPTPAEGRIAAHPHVLVRLRVLLWAGTLLTALVVSAITVTVVQRIVPPPLVPAARHVATLAPDPRAPVPGYFVSARSAVDHVATGYGEYGGLSVVLTPDGWAGLPGPCLYVYDTAAVTTTDSNLNGGPLATGCAAGRFPAIAQLVVTAEQSSAVTDIAAVGTALQFVHEGTRDEVHVFEVAP